MLKMRYADWANSQCIELTGPSPFECLDGGGTITCYPLFDGVKAVLLQLETRCFIETRTKKNALEINFCSNGRFESSFSARDHVILKPGDMSVSTFDGIHGTESESTFPLGYYDGICLHVDCCAAQAWMQRHTPDFAVDFDALKCRLLSDSWYFAGNAGPRCEHVFRELYENVSYFDREYLQLKAVELFMLLARIPLSGAERGYCSPKQLELIRHLRDHLLTDRESYVSLAQLAEEHGISVSHLQKLFRQVYGVPIYRYIKEYRLEQSAVELVRSEKKITEIAMDAGYDSASKFSESFRKRYGVTPSAYRMSAGQAAKRNI